MSVCASGQVVDLLHALPEALADDAARAEADQRLHRLEARALRVGPRVEEAEHARAAVRLDPDRDQPARRPRARRRPRASRAGVPATTSIPAEHQQQRDRGAEVGLDQDQQRRTPRPACRSASRARPAFAARRCGRGRPRPRSASASLASSDGWNVAGPAVSQRRAPLISGADDEHHDAEDERRQHQRRREQRAAAGGRNARRPATAPRRRARRSPCRFRNVIGSPCPSAAAADVALYTMTRPNATSPSVTRTSRRCSSWPRWGASHLRFSTSLLNSSPRCSKSRNWS